MWCWRHVLSIPWTAKRTNTHVNPVRARIENTNFLYILLPIYSYLYAWFPILDTLCNAGTTAYKILLLPTGKRSRVHWLTKLSVQMRDSKYKFHTIERLAADITQWKKFTSLRNPQDHDFQQLMNDWKEREQWSSAMKEHFERKGSMMANFNGSDVTFF